MSVTVRAAVEADRPLLARLHLASWRDAYRGILSDAFLDGAAEADRAAHWASRRWRPSDVARVAEADGAAAGFVFAEIDEAVFIDNLHVLPHARGRGAGRALLREVGLAGAGRRAWLKCFAANVGARRFYSALGGVEVREEDAMSAVRPGRVVVVEWADAATLADPR